MKDYIKSQIEKSCELKKSILDHEPLMQRLADVAQKTIEVYQNGNKTLIAGNGGSAGDAQHLAGEFVSRLYFERPGLPSIALTTDTSVLTAIGNDFGFENLFARQVQANGVKGDMLIAISTSGNSPNILRALEESKKMGLITVGMTGLTGGKMGRLCDFCINVPSEETPRIQESHIMIGHILCSIVEEKLFGNDYRANKQ